MDAVVDVLKYVNVLVAVVSISSAFLSHRAAYRAAKQKLAAAEKQSFENALNSSDLETLGNYLDRNIGAFDVSEYVARKEVSDRVDRYIARILSFVGTEEQISESEKVQRPEALDFADLPDLTAPLVEVQAPFDSFLAEAAEGEPWNALAKLRRHLEIELRNIASKLGFKERHLRSAGQILRLLDDKIGVDMGGLERLRYAVSVSNRAIHGRDVSTAEAEEAVLNAATGLRQLLEQVRNGSIIVVERDR